MVEQLVSLNASQGLNGIEFNNPLSVNSRDVTRFDMTLYDKKIERNSLLDITSGGSDKILQIQKPKETNFIMKMDEEYKVLANKLKEPHMFDKHWSVKKKPDENPVFRSNVRIEAKKPDLEKSFKGLIADMKESFEASGKVSRNVSKWGLRMHIWLSNVHILTGTLGKVSSGLKTLFHSAG